MSEKKKDLAVAIKGFIEKQQKEMSTDQANAERPEQPNPRDKPISKGVYDPIRQVEHNEPKTVVGVDLYPVSSVIHGKIPGEGQNVPAADQVPQEPGPSTEKPVKKPEQER